MASVKFHTWANAMVCVTDAKQVFVCGETAFVPFYCEKCWPFWRRGKDLCANLFELYAFSINIAFYYLFHYDLWVRNKHLNTWRLADGKQMNGLHWVWLHSHQTTVEIALRLQGKLSFPEMPKKNWSNMYCCVCIVLYKYPIEHIRLSSKISFSSQDFVSIHCHSLKR